MYEQSTSLWLLVTGSQHYVTRLLSKAFIRHCDISTSHCVTIPLFFLLVMLGCNVKTEESILTVSVQSL